MSPVLNSLVVVLPHDVFGGPSVFAGAIGRIMQVDPALLSGEQYVALKTTPEYYSKDELWILAKNLRPATPGECLVYEESFS